MAEPSDEVGGELRVQLDERLRADLRQAEEATGIRNKSDLVRYAIRLVARSNGAVRP